MDFCTSHTRTVVRECCKGDDASQRENGKFDPLPRLNPLTDRHKMLLKSWISTDMQNLVAIPPGVSFPRMREIAHQNVYSASFLGTSNDHQPRRMNRFSRVIRQTTRFRARMCLFWVRREKFKIYTGKLGSLIPDIWFRMTPTTQTRDTAHVWPGHVTKFRNFGSPL